MSNATQCSLKFYHVNVMPTLHCYYASKSTQKYEPTTKFFTTTCMFAKMLPTKFIMILLSCVTVLPFSSSYLSVSCSLAFSLSLSISVCIFSTFSPTYPSSDHSILDQNYSFSTASMREEKRDAFLFFKSNFVTYLSGGLNI